MTGAERTLLITGFGGFPGAHFNPTIFLVDALSRSRRLAARGWRVAPHIFRTTYAAVDADLAKIIRAETPDAILMFGLAARTPFLRIERRARNRATVLLSDAAGGKRDLLAIEAAAPACLQAQGGFQGVLKAARGTGLPVRFCRDAGDYLCNYLYWRVLKCRAAPALFVHVPAVRRSPRRKRKRRGITPPELARAGEAIALAFTALMQR